MNILNPLGFILLIALIILLIIYIIKPTYQNKVISTSFIWNETLKRKNRTNPISKLRSLIIIIIQMLMLAVCAIIVSQPMLITSSTNSNEYVVILDSSADMLAHTSGVTRFQRAISLIDDKAKEITDADGYFTLILSDYEGDYYLVQENNYNIIKEKLDYLVNNLDYYCTLGTGNLYNAVTNANLLLSTNSSALLYYYTATNFVYTGDATVVDVSDDTEWNSAILNVTKELTDNTYDFSVDVATYNSNKTLNVEMTASNVNDEGSTYIESKEIVCFNNIKSTVKFSTNIYEYDEIEFVITTVDKTEDSFSYDNIFTLYGGRREEIKIQYSSSAANSFFDGVLLSLQSIYRDTYDVTIYKPETISDRKLTGYDFYIFEHEMPSYVPTDGVSLLVNPDKSPAGFDLTFSSQINGNFTLSGDSKHEIMNYITPSNITSTSYKTISNNSDYEVLMTCDGNPVFVTKNTDTTKVSVLSINLNTSNMALLIDFPILLSNMFNYYFPKTLNSNIYDVEEIIDFNLRNNNGSIIVDDKEILLTNTSSLVVNKNGCYTLTQTLLSGKVLETNFFVRIPQQESDFTTIQDLSILVNLAKPSDFNKDILLYLSISLFILLIVEKSLGLKQQN